MKRIKTFLFSLAASVCSVMAQTDVTNITVHDDQSGQDEVITLPEGMTSNCDSLLNEWMAKQYLYPDTTCVDPNVNPEFANEVYRDRLRRLPVVIDMPYNSIVQKFIDQYCTRLRCSVSYMLGAGNYYVPIIEEALDYYGLPLELKYLPFIESALEPKAKSRAGAVGLWQFMLATGKRYGLEVNSLVDERQDPYKSTWAAVRYLRDLYQIYGDWNLVLAAYNYGPGNINKAIHRAGGVRDYWAIYPYLPEETRGYVPAFIAANYVMNYYCEHNICPMKTKYPISTDTVVVTRDVHMEQIAKLCNIDKEAVRGLNPQYRTDLIPGSAGGMTLCLPTEVLNTFIDFKDSVYNYRADELLKRRTELEVKEPVRAASSSKGRSSRSKYSSSKKSRSRAKTATIRRGDTLGEIARRHHTTVQKLRKLNGIKGSNIRAGKKIRVR